VSLGHALRHFGKVFVMAKRNPPRSQSNGAAAPPARSKARRSRAETAPEPDTIGAYPGVEGTEHLESKSSSMGSEPSEEDIRRRAYQRYLDRGGDHGMDFEDWLQAERELKKSQV
jgi:Protein of unknown function (DUF2934)